MRLLICSVLALLPACATTEFVRTAPAAGTRQARPGRDVELFFGTEPQKAYVQVGYFERAPSDYTQDTAGDLTGELRRKAGYQGCDGLIISPRAELERLAASSSEKAKAQCVMFTSTPPAAIAAPESPAPSVTPAPAPAPAPAPSSPKSPVISSKEEPLKVPVSDSMKATAKEKTAVTDDAACEGGKAEACIRLGFEAESKKDAATALSFFDKACSVPSQRGCTHKGILLLQAPPGVVKDEPQALELFAKACVLDDPIACRYQGVMYVEGKGGMKKSTLGGLSYLEKACTAKDGWACWRISQVYKKGEGTPKDANKAQTFEQTACDNGYTQACKK